MANLVMPVINCRVPAAAPRATMQATASGEYWGHNAQNVTKRVIALLSG
jgi:hypothetical protein